MLLHYRLADIMRDLVWICYTIGCVDIRFLNSSVDVAFVIYSELRRMRYNVAVSSMMIGCVL